jgi:ribA/ribD-fused uncharacterized protein
MRIKKYIIRRFIGKYEFLSNFYPCEIKYKGLVFKSTEAAYQAQKTNIFYEQQAFQRYTPEQAKRAGRRVSLRKDWENIKDRVMLDLIRIKFRDPFLATELIKTYPAQLIEGNYWNDKYWGVCLKTNIGENHLGKILMQVRKELMKNE